MQYAVLGRTGLRVSRLGFGCMRFLMKTPTEVDREVTIPLLHRAFELGITYFDTATMYGGEDSQRVLGEAFQGMRDKVILSTKNPHYDKKDTAGWWKNLEQSLERLRTDYIDVYNFHGMNYETFERSVGGEDGLYREALKAREQGMIRHISHSFHGSAESLKKCVDTGLFESVTLQYNLLDRVLEEAITYAREKGMGVAVMGPVGGGRLGIPSEEAMRLMGGVKSTPELALRFVLSHPHVTLALSGMSSREQLEQNVRTVSEAGALTSEEHGRITAAVQERKELLGLYCTGCGYCMPCSKGVDIPANFEIMNLERVFGLRNHAASRYAELEGKAALCRLCGKCLPLCPQKLDVPTRLTEAVARLDERAGSLSGWAELREAHWAKKHQLAITLRVHVKNFSGQVRDNVRVQIEPHREDEVAPRRWEIENLKPFGLRYQDLELSVRAPLETVSLDAHFDFDHRHTLEHFHYIAAAAQQAPTPGPMIHVPGPYHPALTSSPPVKGHSFDFAVSFNSRSLHVRADVEDDLLCVAAGDLAEKAPADHIRVFLDGRGPGARAHRGYGEGVMHVTVYPVLGEPASAIVRTSNGANAGARIARTPSGYRADITVPLSAFLKDRDAGSIVGFDLVLNSHDAEGKPAARLSWTGHTGQEHDPSKFGTLLLPAQKRRRAAPR